MIILTIKKDIKLSKEYNIPEILSYFLMVTFSPLYTLLSNAHIFF